MIFRGVKKKTTEPVSVATLTFCDSPIDHPAVGDHKHHFHVSPEYLDKICCKCGYNMATKTKIPQKDLQAFRRNYW